MSNSEEELIAALSSVFLADDGEARVDGLDDDLICYISGMLASQEREAMDEPSDSSSNKEEAVNEVLVPFLESVGCPEELMEQAQKAAMGVLDKKSADAKPAVTSATTTRKLTQGVVHMSRDTVSNAADDDATRFLWGTDSGVKAQANNVMETAKDQSSAKEKRKLRKQEAEQLRQLISQQMREQENEEEMGGDSLVRMNYQGISAETDSSEKVRDVQVRNLTLSLDNGTILLDGGELKFAYQRRYGLIGENGVGKSTLLKAMSRNDIEGFPKNLRVLHVRQEVPSHVSNDVSVVQAVLHSDVERVALLNRERELTALLENDTDNDNDAIGGSDTVNIAGSSNLTLGERKELLRKSKEKSDQAASDDAKDMGNLLQELEGIYARLKVLGSDAAESRAAMILSGLQFTVDMQHGPLSALSGGWRMRVALAAALFIEPDICLLDEPSNHLDLEAVLWLESYLKTYKHTLIVVSHDRGFLNEVCTDIIEFKRKKLTYYRGNYDNYVKLRDESIRNSMRVYQAYQSKREHMMEFIEKFRANAKRSTMVQSRIKTVEKMDAEAPEPVEIDQVWRFSIPNAEPVSRPIIAVNDVYFDYTTSLPDGAKKPLDKCLLQQANFGVDLDSRIAILGANGQGKTTLLNLIMGRIKPIKGSVHVNSSLRIGHFTQHSSDNFDLKKSAVENLLAMFEEAEDQEIRSFLGKFQIQGTDALKPMVLLSGGQKSRVAFAALAYKKPHVLVIDEGSNHLSMEAVDALIEAMQDFKGGILVVSHDQYFVSKTCRELWVVHDGKVARFRGDFDEYKKQTAILTQKRVEESVKRVSAVNS